MPTMLIKQENEIVLHYLTEKWKKEAEFDFMTLSKYFGINLKKEELPEAIDDELVFRTSDHLSNELYIYINGIYDTTFNCGSTFVWK